MLKNRFDKTMKASVAGVWVALAMTGCVNVAQQGAQASADAAGVQAVSAAASADAAAAASLQAAASAAASTAKLKAAQPVVYRVRRGDTLKQIAQRNHCNVSDLLAWNHLKPSSRLKTGQTLHVASPAAVKDANDAAAAATAAQAAADRATAKAAASAKLAAASANPQANMAAGAATAASATAVNTTAAASSGSAAAASIAQSGAPAPSPAQARQVDAEVSRHAKRVELVWPAQGTVVQGFQAGETRGIEIGGKPGDPVRAAADGKVMYAGTGLNEYGSLIIIQHNKDFLTAYSHNRRLLVKTGDIVRQGQEIAEMGDENNSRVSVLFEVRRDGKPVDPMPYLPAKQS